MPGDHVAHARKQAELSSPPVRAAARMRIARVQSTVDPHQARRTLEMALEEIHSIPGRDRDLLFEQAQQIAAAVAPDLLPEIPSVRRFPNHHHFGTLVNIMLQHGHIDAAFDFVVQCDAPFSFPFGHATNLIHKLDHERRLTVLRRAIDAWRASQDAEVIPKWVPHVGGHSGLIRLLHVQSAFIRLFQGQWKILPPDEALAVVREVVRIAMEQPDLGTSARYGEGIRITSSREHVFFEVLHILRHLDVPLAEFLLANHEQLAAATRRYPDGHETIVQEAEERRKQLVASGSTCGGGGFVMAGDPRDFAYQMALQQSSQGGDFAPSIDHALERYREDIAPEGPNQAPKTFWPSTCAFRNILYSAGKRLGPEAGILLDRIPDDDLRLFAQIELAAALAGLPELPETWEQRREPPARHSA
jgi:hypothetical protein